MTQAPSRQCLEKATGWRGWRNSQERQGWESVGVLEEGQLKGARRAAGPL